MASKSKTPRAAEPKKDDKNHFRIAAPKMLNSEPVVRSIVQAFAADLLIHLAEPPDTAVQWIAGEAYRMNQLFIGIGLPRSFPDVERLEEWHCPSGLGQFICTHMTIEGDIARSVEAAFAMFASAVINSASMEEAEAKSYLDEICHIQCSALLGLPGHWILPVDRLRSQGRMNTNSIDVDGLRLATDPSSRGKYLGDPSVVSGLVRGYAAHVFTLRSEWHEAPDDEKIDPTEEIEQLATKLGDIFLGRDPAYVRQPFNAANRLGVLMRHLVPTSGDPGQPFFLWFAKQMVQASMELEAGGDEATVFGQVEAIAADFIERLLGRQATGQQCATQ